MGRKPMHRNVTCENCGREFAVKKKRWRCPYCNADNRPTDYRYPGTESPYDTGVGEKTLRGE